MRRFDGLNVIIEHKEEYIRTKQHTNLEVYESDGSLRCSQPKNMKSPLKLSIYVGGIIVFYSLYGIFLEKLFKGKYGPAKESFDCQYSVLLVQCLLNGLLAKILLKTVWNQGPDCTSYPYYFAASFFYIVAMITSTIALRFVNYPTQVIAKSCKPIPVMILGVLLARKRYSLIKYCFILLIVIGVATFMYEEKKGVNMKSTRTTSENTMFSYALLVVSLLCDGLIGAVQDQMRQKFQTKSLHMMSQLNFISLIYISLALVYTGEFSVFLTFTQNHPRIYVDVALFSLCSALGQIFIYSTVAQFGPLVCSVATTTRKFFTVLCSVLLFGNALSEQKWIGTVLVFSGLFLDAFYGKSAPSAKTA